MRETGPNVITRNALLGGLTTFGRETPSSSGSRSEQDRGGFGKEKSPIDLRRPLEEVISSVVSLPWGHAGSENVVTEAEFRALLRGVYEAANGRQVETTIGFIPIAQPVAEFLKAKPYQATSRIDFLMEIAARMLCGPDDSRDEEANLGLSPHEC